MKKIINIIIILFLFVSCGQKKSITNFQDVYIYASKEDRYLIEDIIENYLFNFTFHTPTPQKRYNPIWSTDLDFIKKPKNAQLMLVSIENPIDTTIDVIANRLLSNSNNEKNMILINDYFFKEQKLFVLKYPDQTAMMADIYNRKEWILNELRNNDINRIRDYSFRSGMNYEVIEKIDSLFSIKVDIQKDYEIIKFNEDEKYAWIGRTYPYRWILIYEDDINNYNSPQNTWAAFNEKFDKILNIDIIPYETQFEQIIIDEEEVNKLYGIFGTKIDSKNPTGGPFIAYIFRSKQSSRALITVGFVNFPGGNKVFHIKELEYIIETIKIDERNMSYD